MTNGSIFVHDCAGKEKLRFDVRETPFGLKVFLNGFGGWNWIKFDHFSYERAVKFLRKLLNGRTIYDAY